MWWSLCKKLTRANVSLSLLLKIQNLIYFLEKNHQFSWFFTGFWTTNCILLLLFLKTCDHSDASFYEGMELKANRQTSTRAVYVLNWFYEIERWNELNICAKFKKVTHDGFNSVYSGCKQWKRKPHTYSIMTTENNDLMSLHL